MTWEEAVKDLRSKAENKQTILDNYFEEDIFGSAERFYLSEEYKAVEKLIPSGLKTALDIGAGRGIASYALAKTGLTVTALEPDTSNDIGSGAIKFIAQKANLPISIVESFGESLPFDDNTFDVVYARQVLHHAYNLEQFCKEVFRVMKPGGVFIASREHVLTTTDDLQAFLDNHTLHYLYGGENAFTLSFYLSCINNAGFNMQQIIHPYASVMNFAPVTEKEMKANFTNKLASMISKPLANLFISFPFIYKKLVDMKASKDNTPGRLYSFVSIKPKKA